MNRLHRWYCQSSQWKQKLENKILPWSLGGVDFTPTPTCRTSPPTMTNGKPPTYRGVGEYFYEVKSLSPHHRFVIALHSPDKVAETGLRMCRPEKCRRLTPFDPEQSVLSSPLCGRNIAKYGHLLHISRQKAGPFLCS